MIKSIIVEDEPRNADVMKSLLSKYCPEVEVLAVAQTVKLAIASIDKYNPELIFLDVELPDGSGFSVLENFPEKSFDVIFVTAFEHYAIKAIKASALDYLLKPLDIDELIEAVAKVKKEKDPTEMKIRRKMFLENNSQKNSYSQKIALPTMEGLMFIAQEDIIYCMADGNYTKFFLKSKQKILVSKPLQYFEEILDDEYFCRTHQSYLVNLMHVTQYLKGRGGYLVMSDDTKVPVSVRMKTDLFERFAK